MGGGAGTGQGGESSGGSGKAEGECRERRAGRRAGLEAEKGRGGTAYRKGMPLLVDALRRVQGPVEGVREPAVADEGRGFEERGEAEGAVGGAGPSGPEACSLRAVTTSRRQQGAVGHGSAGGTTGGEQGREAEVQRREAEGAVAKGRGRKRERDVVRGSGRASRAGDVPAGGRR